MSAPPPSTRCAVTMPLPTVHRFRTTRQSPVHVSTEHGPQAQSSTTARACLMRAAGTGARGGGEVDAMLDGDGEEQLWGGWGAGPVRPHSAPHCTMPPHRIPYPSCYPEPSPAPRPAPRITQHTLHHHHRRRRRHCAAPHRIVPHPALHATATATAAAWLSNAQYTMHNAQCQCTMQRASNTKNT